MNNSITFYYPDKRPSLFERALMLIRNVTEGLTGSRSSAKESLESRFNDIIRTHSDMITRICFGYSTSTEELEDLRQDTLINIWQGLDRFKGESSVKTWIYRITLNTCVSTIRKRKPDSLPLTDIYQIIDEDEEKRALIRELHETISKLPPVDKAIIMLWLDEFSYEEIAAMTGMPRNTVATRIKRAKEKMKNMTN